MKLPYPQRTRQLFPLGSVEPSGKQECSEGSEIRKVEVDDQTVEARQVVRRAVHPGSDQCEAAADSNSHEAVGLRPIPDHHRCGRVKESLVSRKVLGDCSGHRGVGLASNRRYGVTGRRDRSQNRTSPGFEATRCGVRAVGVGTDESGAGVDRSRGSREPSIVEIAMQPDQHRIEASIPAVNGAVVEHRNCSARFDRLDDPWPAGDQNTFARLNEKGCCDRRADDVTDSWNSDVFQRRLMLGDHRCRVVRDEDDAAASGAEGGDSFNGTWYGFVGQPNHSIKVAQHSLNPLDGNRLDTHLGIVADHWHAGGVPRFTPFPALRYADRQIDDLIAPPYDVLSPSDVDDLNNRHRCNITHVDVPRESDGAGRYEQAGKVLREWIDAGVLEYDDAPTFTIYRMRFTDATGAARDIAGVLGGLEVVDEGSGGVLPHERVTPKASTDRLDLTRATGANMSPVWGLSLADGLTDLLAEPGELLSSVTVEGVEHIIERVADAERVAAIATKVGSDDVLIADGHHRYGISRTFRDEVRSQGLAGSPAEDTLAFVSELVADQLSVEAIHRLYSDISFDDLVAALDTAFDRSDAGTPSAATLAEMNERGALCLIGPDGNGQWLTPKDGAFDGVRSLDGAWLEHVLGDTPHSVTYQHGVDHVVEAATGGRAMAAVLIRPVSVAEIERTAREGLLMPPKSTFFTPKLRTGLVVRSVT